MDEVGLVVVASTVGDFGERQGWAVEQINHLTEAGDTGEVTGREAGVMVEAAL